MRFDFLNIYKEFLGDSYNTYFSPGRVNLIGEHIDYLGGNVFPTAISLGTYGFVSKRNDREIHMISHNFKEVGKIVVNIDDLAYRKEDDWTNYVKGMFKTYIEKNYEISQGLNILIYGTLPNSSGLSSSASLEVLAGTIIKHEYQLPLSNLQIVLDSKDVENNYVGISCGIMDQFAIGMSEKNKAIFLDTKTLNFEQVPLELGEYCLVIANTNKKRSLVESKYNQRVNECGNALKIIKEHDYEIEEICDLQESDLVDVKQFLPQVEYKRVYHAVTENNRTKKAVKYLQESKIREFGKLLYQSHYTLKDYYEVSCKELDLLVESFKNNKAIGARMTGAGFGGCAIAICHKNNLADVIKNVKADYLKGIGYETNIYEVIPSGGPIKIEVNE